MKNCLKKDTRWTKDDLFGTHYCQQQKTHWRHEMRTRSHHVWTNSCCCLDTAANWTQIRRDTSGVQQNQMIIQFCCCLVNLTVFSPPTAKSNHKSILLHPWSVSSVLWRIWWTFSEAANSVAVDNKCFWSSSIFQHQKSLNSWLQVHLEYLSSGCCSV